jgi:hypothetical protein
MSNRLTQRFDPGPESALGLLPSIALSSTLARLNLIDSERSCNVLYRLGSPEPSFFPSGLEFFISLGNKLFLLASKLLVGCHISNRTVPIALWRRIVL